MTLRRSLLTRATLRSAHHTSAMIDPRGLLTLRTRRNPVTHVRSKNTVSTPHILLVRLTSYHHLEVARTLRRHLKQGQTSKSFRSSSSPACRHNMPSLTTESVIWWRSITWPHSATVIGLQRAGYQSMLPWTATSGCSLAAIWQPRNIRVLICLRII